MVACQQWLDIFDLLSLPAARICSEVFHHALRWPSALRAVPAKHPAVSCHQFIIYKMSSTCVQAFPQCRWPGPKLNMCCRRGERIAFSYLISQKYTGETAQLDILRDGEELSVTVTLDRPHPLVPIHLEDKQPSYLVVAGAHPFSAAHSSVEPG